MRTLLLRCVVVTLLCVMNAVASQAQSLNDPRLTIQVVATGLEQPTSLAFLAQHDLLIGEKNTGRIRRVLDGQIAATVLDLPVATDETHGLLGITLDPDFATNGHVYVYYSQANADDGEWIENRVSRFTWNGASLDPSSEFVVTRFPRDPSQSNAMCEGGKLAFGPDGLLYGTTGDLSRGDFANPRLEQNTAGATAGIGGVFRIMKDGSVPADNPFASNASETVRKWFAYGIRQSFGMDFDPRTGVMWITENGPEVYDEISLVAPGYNSGWLKLMGPDARNAMYERNKHGVFDASDLVMLPSAHYDDPKFSFLQPVGVTTLTFIDSARFPANLRDNILVGDTNFGFLYFFSPNAARDDLALPAAVSDDRVADTSAERASVIFGEGWGITTELKIGPDGFLYHLSLLDGALRRIRPIIQTADMNGDDSVNAGDIVPFVLALTNPSEFAAQYPEINANEIGDCNGDGILTPGDIAGFVRLLNP